MTSALDYTLLPRTLAMFARNNDVDHISNLYICIHAEVSTRIV